MFKSILSFLQKIFKKGILKKAKEAIEEVDVSVGTLRLIVPVDIKAPNYIPISNIETAINKKINQYIEPRLKNVIDFEIKFNIVAK